MNRGARAALVSLGVALFGALGGCNLILNLDEAAPSADASSGGAGGSSGLGGGSTDASVDMVASGDVVVSTDGPLMVTDARDAAPSPGDASQGDGRVLVDATGDVRADATSDGPVTPDAALEAGPPPKLACAVMQVSGTGAPLATGTTVGGSNNFTGTCSSGVANDIAFDWIVPATDWYTVNTLGSSFDTVLYLRDPVCTGGAELSCNNNTATVPQSEILAHLNQNQRLLAVVDGNVGASGTVNFNAQRITCPAIDLTGQPLPATLSTVGGTNTHTGACGGAGLLEATYRFTPTVTGLYSITAKSTDFAPILYVEQGPRCGDALLGCNKGGSSSLSYPAEVVRYLTAGQPVTITVDGGSGFFTLNAVRVIEDAGMCGSAPLPPPDGTTVTTLPGYAASHETASCAVAGGLDGVGQGPYGYGDFTYAMPINLAQGVGCTYHIDASGPFTLYVIDGACSGGERSCVPSMVGGPMGYQANFSASMIDNGMHTLVVENTSFITLMFTLSMFCIA